MIAGINKAYMLPYDGAERANGSITVKAGYKWERVQLQRDSAAYEISTTLGKIGKVTKHTATMDVLTISAQEVHRYREKCRTRHLLALVLNSGETVIAGINAPMRMKMEPSTDKNPEGAVGFALRFECQSREGKSQYAGDLEPAIINMVTGYGFLYNGYAVETGKALIADGWRIPSIDDFNALEAAVRSDSSWLKADYDWRGEHPLNSSGFSAIPSGTRDMYSGLFFERNINACYWGSNNTSSIINFLSISYSGIYINTSTFSTSCNKLRKGMAIRLCKPYAGGDIPTYVTDYDGNSYAVVLIGELLWMATDYRSKKYMDGTEILLAQAAADWALATTNAAAAYCIHPGVNDEAPL